LQGQFLHHDAITGTSKDFVVEDFESQLHAAYSGSQSVMRMALQALITHSKLETPYVFHPETVREKYNKAPTKVMFMAFVTELYAVVPIALCVNCLNSLKSYCLLLLFFN
jgi:hypothetical protein